MAGLTQAKPTKAVIYTRVSGAKQVREGDGLASQENRCREYATYKDYDVIEVFSDDMSGKFERRPAMDRMLAFLRLNRKQNVVVIIDDISRFARNVQAPIKLRETLADAGGILESPSIEFGEDSDSRLVEHMLASAAQHQREKNAEQTSNRMKGRMMNGYAVFAAPMGYAYKKTGSHGKLLTRVEPLASVIQEGLEGYASGRIATQAELKRFFESQPNFPKDLPNGQIRQQRITDLLNRVIYAGYIESDKWGVTRRKGHHEPLISLETFNRIQDRRTARNIAPARKDIREDFPLRGAVTCACCEQPLTSCWSKSASGKRYPYDWCQTRDCFEYRKSIRAEKIDDGFADLLRSMTPTENLFGIVSAMLKDAWDQRAELEEDKFLLAGKAGQTAKPKRNPGEIFELLKAFLSNPWTLYENGSLALKKPVLRTALQEPLAYDRKTGFRTPQASVIFEFFGAFTSKYEMVRSEGLEPSLLLQNSDLNAARLPIPPRPHMVR